MSSPVSHLSRTQTTLAGEICLEGVGVHSGKLAKIRILPAVINSGICFHYKSNNTQHYMSALWDKVSQTRLCTVIKDNVSKYEIATIEHLMAALAGLSIDNAFIEIDAPEIPIMDGSAHDFVKAINAVGCVSQTALRQYIEIIEPVRVENGDSYAEIIPYDGWRVEVTIDFPDEIIGHQSFAHDITPEIFCNELAAARTFGRAQELEMLHQNGHARGASLDNAIAVDGDKVLNVDGIRWPNEFARHKALDAIGDLALAGAPLLGCFSSFKGGHALNNQLLHALFDDEKHYRLTELNSQKQEPFFLPVKNNNAQTLAVRAQAAATL